ncbi:hypothetical protein [Pedobacter sp. N23S346]|uniref:hypothetical protein n=1 Tax=Pedobacter sp. N23S346 TaxID=3402750 RepID=UPI003AC9D51C
MKFLLLLLTCAFITTGAFCQISDAQNQNNQPPYQSNSTSGIYTFKKRWIVGVGINAINDGGFDAENSNRYFKNFFNTKSWDVSVLTLFADYGFSKSFSVNGMLTGNNDRFSGDKLFAADLNLKYSFAKLMPRDYWFEPYLMAGIGYTWRDAARKDKFNTNFGLGTFIWANNQWGLNLQAMGKLTLNKNPYSYKQGVLGIVYRIENQY